LYSKVGHSLSSLSAQIRGVVRTTQMCTYASRLQSESGITSGKHQTLTRSSLSYLDACLLGHNGVANIVPNTESQHYLKPYDHIIIKLDATHDFVSTLCGPEEDEKIGWPASGHATREHSQVQSCLSRQTESSPYSKPRLTNVWRFHSRWHPRSPSMHDPPYRIPEASSPAAAPTTPTTARLRFRVGRAQGMGRGGPPLSCMVMACGYSGNRVSACRCALPPHVRLRPAFAPPPAGPAVLKVPPPSPIADVNFEV
jgi:hypothetical protein